MTEFSFDASVLGLGGYFVCDGRPTLIPSVASAVLAPTGGEGWSSAENYNTPEISFSRAESRVRGYQTSDGFFTTISDIYITNLRVFDQVRIALLQATVTSNRSFNGDAEEGEFQLQALYRGIDVAGNDVVPAIDLEVCHASYSTLLDRANAELERELAAAGGTEDVTTAARQGPRKLTDRDPVRATIVKEIRHSDAARLHKPSKNVVTVPGLGRLRFGELVAKRGRRRISLLRLDLDTAVAGAAGERGSGASTPSYGSGSITFASVGGNGEPVWPRG